MPEKRTLACLIVAEAMWGFYDRDATVFTWYPVKKYNLRSWDKLGSGEAKQSLTKKQGIKGRSASVLMSKLLFSAFLHCLK